MYLGGGIPGKGECEIKTCKLQAVTTATYDCDKDGTTKAFGYKRAVSSKGYLYCSAGPTIVDGGVVSLEYLGSQRGRKENKNWAANAGGGATTCTMLS